MARTTKATLGLTALEAREVPATAVLRSGVLIVTGDNTAETIAVRQTPSQVIVDGVGAAFPAAAVSSIRIDLYGGNDSVNLQVGRAVVSKPAAVYGGSGNDTVHGGSANDQLDGGAGDDHLYGYGGADKLLGGDGHDRLYGDVGNDTITGGAGNDAVYAWQGNDTVYGDTADPAAAAGDDEIYGGPQNDRIYAGRGNDTVYADEDNDYVEGNDGNDRLFGRAGLDTLVGGAGDDRLAGDEGADSLTGGTGHDWLTGGIGVDTLSGGDGNDGLLGGPGDEGDRVTGGGGHDRFLDWTAHPLGRGEARTDVAAEDAVVFFRDAGEQWVLLGSNMGWLLYAAGTWAEGEIEAADKGLIDLQNRTGNTVLLETSLGGSLTFHRAGRCLQHNGRGVAAGWNGGGGSVTFADGTFVRNSDGSLAEWAVKSTVVHEVGHNWDDPVENPFFVDWLNASGWELHLPGWHDVAPPQGKVRSGDGLWWHTADDGLFARSYGKMNPLEDFATMWERVFYGVGDGGFGGRTAAKTAQLDAFFGHMSRQSPR